MQVIKGNWLCGFCNGEINYIGYVGANGRLGSFPSGLQRINKISFIGKNEIEIEVACPNCHEFNSFKRGLNNE